MSTVMLNAGNTNTDIQSVINFVNQYDQGGARIAPEHFYQKQLLDTIRYDQDAYVYFRMADTSPIQDKADKLVLKRWSALQGHTVPLYEGIPPKSDRGSVKSYELQAFQYGRYMEFTDRVDFKVVDPVIAHFTKEYALVAMETLDLLARDALIMNAQRYYAGGSTSPDGLTFTNAKPNMTDLRRIVLSMKKALVKPKNGTKFPVTAGPEFYYDMLADDTVKQYMTINNTTKTMFDDPANLVPMFGMEFYEAALAYSSGEYVDADGVKRLKYYVPGTPVVISTSDSLTDACLSEDDGYLADADPYTKDPQTGLPASYIPDRKVWELPEDAREFKMMHVLILGKDALTRTGLAGQDSAKMYVKPLGSAGVLDPIDQRQSIGFKINSVGFGSSRPEAIVDYICVPSLLNDDISFQASYASEGNWKREEGYGTYSPVETVNAEAAPPSGP
jgi:hypothetical protein